MSRAGEDEGSLPPASAGRGAQPAKAPRPWTAGACGEGPPDPGAWSDEGQAPQAARGPPQGVRGASRSKSTLPGPFRGGGSRPRRAALPRRLRLRPGGQTEAVKQVGRGRLPVTTPVLRPTCAGRPTPGRCVGDAPGRGRGDSTPEGSVQGPLQSGSSCEGHSPCISCGSRVVMVVEAGPVSKADLETGQRCGPGPWMPSTGSRGQSLVVSGLQFGRRGAFFREGCSLWEGSPGLMLTDTACLSRCPTRLSVRLPAS